MTCKHVAPSNFFSIEGGDGAGKTTTIKLVHKALIRAGRRSRLVHPNYPLCEEPHARRFFASMLPPLRTPRHILTPPQWVQLTTVWFSAVEAHVIRPALAAGEIVLADTWFDKRLAHFSLQGPDVLDQARRCAAAVRLGRPTLTCLLDVDPVVAADRKSHFSYAETGNLEMPREQTRENFIAYQCRLRVALQAAAKAEDWLVISSDASTPGQAVQRILSALDAHKWF
jgi:thymidylate kinase